MADFPPQSRSFEDPAGFYDFNNLSAVNEATGRDNTAYINRQPRRRISSGRANSEALEQQIDKLLADASPRELAQWGLRPGQNAKGIPLGFKLQLRRFVLSGRLREDVVQYYMNLPRGDSTSFPDPNGVRSPIQAILKQDAAAAESGARRRAWRPGRLLGKGGYGSVVLWQKLRRGKPVCVYAAVG